MEKNRTALIILVILCVVALGSIFALGFTRVKLEKTDGRGYSTILNDGHIYTTVDSTQAMNADTFYFESFDAGDMKIYQGALFVDTVDTNYGLDSAYVRLWTAMERGRTGLKKIVASDSFAISGGQYRYYKGVSSDTGLWGETWLELIIVDSTNAAVHARTAATAKIRTHDYKVGAWLNFR